MHVDLSKITNNLLHKGIIVDFYIEDINLIIEVHGEQHYKPSSFGAKQDDALTQYQKQLNRDFKLRDICTDKSINLLEIPYNKFDSSELVSKILSYQNEI